MKNNSSNDEVCDHRIYHGAQHKETQIPVALCMYCKKTSEDIELKCRECNSVLKFIKQGSNPGEGYYILCHTGFL